MHSPTLTTTARRKDARSGRVRAMSAEDYNIARAFEAERVNRMAQIDRLWDFEEPVTVTATDTETDEVRAHFRMDPDGSVTDLIEAPPAEHVLTSHAIGVQPTEVRARVHGTDFDPLDGASLGEMCDFYLKAFTEGFPHSAKVKAWTRDDGTVIRLAVVTEGEQ